MENTVAEFHRAESYGGFMAAIDSSFNVESSLIAKAQGDSRSCAIFVLGKSAEAGRLNSLSSVGIDNNQCD